MGRSDREDLAELPVCNTGFAVIYMMGDIMKRFSSKAVWILLSLLLLMGSASLAGAEIIYATHKYIMGDNDSKNDARRMCFLEAKRKAIEKAGTYIESLTEVKDARLTKDEVRAYSSALLKVETIKENWKLVGNNMAVILKVKADVDTSHILKELSKIGKDTSVQKKIISQQKRLKSLERKVVSLQKQLGKVDAPRAATLRKDRNVVFKQIDELEAKKIAILSKIKSRARDAVRLVERGMNKDDVRSLVGNPRTTSAMGWNYGEVWVVFENGLVGCLVKPNCFKMLYCSSYNKDCIVK